MIYLPHGMKIGTATVIVDIVPRGNPEIRPGIFMKPQGITDHDTGNTGRGADAKAHNKLLHNWGRLPVKDTSHVSWHGAIDEDYIIQHLPFNEPAYHCGDGWGITSGNRTTIGFEKCMHQGADRNKIEANAIALYAYLMKEMGFPISAVRPHQYWSGKYCPQLILNKYGSFRPFREKVELAYKTGKIPTVSRDYLIHGDTGKEVGKYQKLLNLTGAKPRLIEDNIFGDDTKTAVIAFQRSAGLDPDGVIGKQTKAKIAAVIDKLTTPTKPPAKPAEKPKEDDELDKELIVIHSEKDYITAQKLSIRNNIKVIERRAVKGKMAKTAYVVGGSEKGIEGVADKFINLSGKTWEETVQKVEDFLKKK